MSEPLVTVYILAYNGEKWIGEAIESVLAQSYRDFILLVSDDGSKDRTLEIARSYQDERMAVVANATNLNIRHSRTLMEKCATKYFKMLMQDDLLEPDCLERQVRVMEAHPSVGVTSSSMRFIINGTQIPFKYNNHSEGIYNEPSKLMRRLLLVGNWIGSPSQTLIRTVTMKNRPASWNYPFLGELTWYYHIFSQGFKYFHIKKPLSCYRLQRDMKTLNHNTNVVGEYLDFIRKEGHQCGVKPNGQVVFRLFLMNLQRMLKQKSAICVLRLLEMFSMKL